MHIPRDLDGNDRWSNSEKESSWKLSSPRHGGGDIDKFVPANEPRGRDTLRSAHFVQSAARIGYRTYLSISPHSTIRTENCWGLFSLEFRNLSTVQVENHNFFDFRCHWPSWSVAHFQAWKRRQSVRPPSTLRSRETWQERNRQRNFYAGNLTLSFHVSE